MLQAGAMGYVTKRSTSETLIGAIRIVSAGGTYIDPDLANSLLMRSIGRQAPGIDVLKKAPTLTYREEQVLRLVAWGNTNKDVAQASSISIKTVECYRADASAKLGLRGRTEIIRYALAAQWMTDLNAPE